MEAAMTMKLVAAGSASAASVLAFAAWRRMAGEGRRGIVRAMVAPVAARLRPTNAQELEALTAELAHAGRRERDAVDRFLEDKVVFVVGGLVVALVAAFWLGGLWGMVLADAALVAGVLGPKQRLAWRAAERREAVAQGLPPAIDLLTTCIDAGLSLEQAIGRVARDLQWASPTLAAELSLTASELEAGVSLPDGLRRMSRRVGLDDLSALCGVIAQAHALGAPVGQTLRDYADASRRQRMSLLEERAGKVAAQLTLPLAVCFLPAAMLVILGPAAVQLIRALQ